MIKFYKSLILLVILAGVLLPNLSLAWVPGESIVSCGGYYACINGTCINAAGSCRSNSDCGPRPSCTKCDLFKLLKNLIDFFMIAAAPIVATLFFVIAGVYLMLGGANPGMLSTGKRIFKDTMIGLIIVMLAWLFTNTLIQTVADWGIIQGVTNTSGSWWQFSCTNDASSGTNGPYNPGGPSSGNGNCGASLTSGPGARVDGFDLNPKTISASNRNVGITFKVTASRSLIRNTCGGSAGDSFYWTIYERFGGSDRVIRDCASDARGCPSVSGENQCFNLDFSVSLPAPAVNYPVDRSFYAFIECNNTFGNNIAQSADSTIRDNQ